MTKSPHYLPCIDNGLIMGDVPPISGGVAFAHGRRGRFSPALASQPFLICLYCPTSRFTLRRPDKHNRGTFLPPAGCASAGRATTRKPVLLLEEASMHG